jgi:hypothetical protein
MLMHCARVDLENACALVGLDERASQAVHDAWGSAPKDNAARIPAALLAHRPLQTDVA